MPRMPDSDVLAETQRRVADATGFLSSGLSAQREKALQYYRGDLFGNEVEGRSQVVSRDVAQYIDTVMPQLMRIFCSGDVVVRFNPVEEGDEEAAQQATEYVNHVWMQENDGFQNLHTLFKDALLNKLGVVKVWWDATPERTRERYNGVSEEALTSMYANRDIEVAEPTRRMMLEPMPDGTVAQIPVYDVEVTKVAREGRVKVSPVPPNEFLFGSRAKSAEDADVLAHRREDMMRSELIAMGYKRDLVESLTVATGTENTGEVITRHADVDDNLSANGTQGEGSTERVEYVEAYLRLDRDDDGEAEYLKVCYSGNTLLMVEEVDDHPFAMVTPNPMPHRLAGLSMADQLFDIQEIKSAVQRQILDNLYLSNMPRLSVVDGQVNIDDLLNPRTGGIVRMKQPGAVMPMPTPTLGQEPYSMIEYLDTVGEQRTGATRYNQGLDANSLNKTATGVTLIQNAAAMRVELIARVFAETGVKRAFRLILKLVSKNETKPRVLRLRGKWVPMDPRGWRDNMDLTIEVGLGNGNRDQVLAHLMTLLNVDMQIVQFQGGVQGPLVTPTNVYHKLKKLCEAAGLKGDQYYTDPASAPPQQPQPDPRLVEAQMKMQLEQQKTQAQLQLDQQKAAAQLQMEEAKGTRSAEIEMWKAEREIELKRLMASQDAAIKMQTAEAQMDMDRVRVSAEREAKMTDMLIKRTVELNRQAVEPVGAKVNEVEQTIQQALQAMKEFAARADALGQRIEEMAADLNAPREIVRGEDGRAMGVRVGSKVRTIARDGSGKATGLN